MCALPGGSVSVLDPRNLTFSCPSHQRLFKAHVRIRGEGVSSSSHDVLPSDENALLEALKNPHDPRSLRVALPDGGVLTSFAKRLPDDRTDVERAFPEMFVEKLVKKGWSETKHTPLSVLNPEHPQFVGKKQQKP